MPDAKKNISRILRAQRAVTAQRRLAVIARKIRKKEEARRMLHAP